MCFRKRQLFFFLLLFLLSSGELHAKELRMSLEYPKDSLNVQFAKDFAAKVKNYSDGSLTIRLFYKGKPGHSPLGGEEDAVTAVSEGTGVPHLTLVAVNNVMSKASSVGLFSLPYIFPTVDHAYKFFRSDFAKKQLNEKLSQQANMRALAWIIGGYRHLSNSQKPVATPADLAGLKIRTPMNPIMLYTYRLFGAEVVPVKWSETTEALKNGTVDGQENPFGIVAGMKFWNARQKYITENGPILWTGPVLINENFFQSLSSHEQETLTRAANECVEVEWKKAVEAQERLRSTCEHHGITIVEVPDKSEWIKRSQPVWKKFYSVIGNGNTQKGKELVEKAVQASR